MLMISLAIKGMKDSYDELYGDGATPVLEQQWYAGHTREVCPLRHPRQ